MDKTHIEQAFNLVDENEDGIWDGEEVFYFLLETEEEWLKGNCVVCALDEDFFTKLFETFSREIGDSDETLSVKEVLSVKTQLIDGTIKLSTKLSEVIFEYFDKDKNDELTTTEIGTVLTNNGIEFQKPSLIKVGIVLILRLFEFTTSDNDPALTRDVLGKIYEKLENGDVSINDKTIDLVYSQIDKDVDGIATLDEIYSWSLKFTTADITEEKKAKDKKSLEEALVKWIDADGKPGISKEELKDLGESFICLFQKGICVLVTRY